MTHMSSWPTPADSMLDQFLTPRARRLIEQRYYLRVQQQAELSALVEDPGFLARPNDHVALFADHGIAHVRDVATRSIAVLDRVHGILIPRRDNARLEFMRGLCALLAYVHDIGMAEPGRQARAMHPEFAVQEVLSDAFDDIIAEILADDRGGVLPRLVAICGAERLSITLREVMATAMAHSKSKVPVALLCDRVGLQLALIEAASCELDVLHAAQTARRLGARSEASNDELAARRMRLPGLNSDLAADAFGWLVAEDPDGLALSADVIDCLRVLRAADALRQRGTTLKTSSNNEIFVDQRNATAVFALRLDSKRLYLLETADPTSAGEANLRSSELDGKGNLCISFHHGQFKDADTIAFAAQSAALIVADIHADTLGSFVRPLGSASDDILARIAGAEIQLESVDDNPAFSALVKTELETLDPLAAAHVRLVPALATSTPLERSRYLDGGPIDWDLTKRQAVLAEIARFGHRVDGIDPTVAFTHVRRVQLEANDVLVEAGAPSGFVYVPLDQGLCGEPLGGYAPFEVPAWTPVGVTGVVRGGPRNATIVARNPIWLIAIPKDVYLEHWHRTYNATEFADLFGQVRRPDFASAEQ